MSFWGRLFGSSEVVDAAISTGDKIFYTNEEKADHFARTLKLYEPFKIAQRFIALIVGIPFVSVHVICTLAWLVAAAKMDATAYVTFTERMGEIMAQNNSALGLPFALIVGFYFAGGAAESFFKSKLGK